MSSGSEPIIIQGGMGAAVSCWRLAQAVAQTGQMGVVSGTALDVVLARRLQLGDPGGHMRRAMAEFPIPGVADKILERYFIEGGKQPDEAFRAIPMPSITTSSTGWCLANGAMTRSMRCSTRITDLSWEPVLVQFASSSPKRRFSSSRSEVTALQAAE